VPGGSPAWITLTLVPMKTDRSSGSGDIFTGRIFTATPRCRARAIITLHDFRFSNHFFAGVLAAFRRFNEIARERFRSSRFTNSESGLTTDDSVSNCQPTSGQNTMNMYETTPFLACVDSRNYSLGQSLFCA